MKYGKQTIGIIGIKGAFGRWLEKFFRAKGFAINGSDVNWCQVNGSLIRTHDTHQANTKVVQNSDVVIFAVRLSRMVSVISSLIPYSRKNQLWIDIGSRKADIMKSMSRSRAEVVGMHPLFAPPDDMSWKGKSLVISIGNLSRWSKWFGMFIAGTGATVLRADPNVHDSMMIRTQNVPQAALIALAMTLANSPCTADDLLAFSTTASRKVLALIASVLANTPEVYADIQVGNPAGIAALDQLIVSLRELRDMAAEGRTDDIVELLAGLRIIYGEEFIAAGKKGFPR